MTRMNIKPSHKLFTALDVKPEMTVDEFQVLLGVPTELQLSPRDLSTARLLVKETLSLKLNTKHYMNFTPTLVALKKEMSDVLNDILTPDFKILTYTIIKIKYDKKLVGYVFLTKPEELGLATYVNFPWATYYVNKDEIELATTFEETKLLDDRLEGQKSAVQKRQNAYNNLTGQIIDSLRVDAASQNNDTTELVLTIELKTEEVGADTLNIKSNIKALFVLLGKNEDKQFVYEALEQVVLGALLSNLEHECDQLIMRPIDVKNCLDNMRGVLDSFEDHINERYD